MRNIIIIYLFIYNIQVQKIVKKMNEQEPSKHIFHEKQLSNQHRPTDQYLSRNFMTGMGINMSNLDLIMPQNFNPQENEGDQQNLIDSLLMYAQCQNYALKNLISKVQSMTQRTSKLNQQLSDLRINSNTMGSSFNENFTGNETVSSSAKPIDNINANSLIKILFGENQQYKYKLQQFRPIQNPLYRQRNFSIDVELVDLDGNKVQNTNKIPLSLAIYTSENPPKFLQTNTMGLKMVKGYTQQNLYNGYSKFQKIQIRQVTSHFRNGWIFIVIIPSMTPLGEDNKEKNYVYYKEIQPLVLEKIVVKAKKIKETKQTLSKNQSKMLVQSLEQDDQLLSKRQKKQDFFQEQSFQQN